MKTLKSNGNVKFNRYLVSNWQEYLFSVLNVCIGLGNFLSFPAKVYEYRGGAFLVAYGSMLVLLGWPVLYLELIIGQYHRCSPIIFIRRCAPILKGLGWIAVISAFFTVLFYQYSVAREFKFLISLAQSRSEKVSLSTCGNSWNTDDCYQFFNENCPEMKKAHIFYENRCVNESSLTVENLESAEVQYLQSKIQKIGPTHVSFANFDFGMFYGLLIIWILIAFTQNKRNALFQNIPTLLVFTFCPFLLIRSQYLVGADEGLSELFSVEWSDLLYTKIWLDATSLVISSLTIGTGVHTVIASFAPPFQHTFRVATIAVLADSALSLIVTATVYSILGSVKTVIRVKSVYDIPLIPTETLLTHSTILILLRQVSYNAWIWMLVYFSVLFIVGWKSCALVFKSITVTMADNWNLATDTFAFDAISVVFAVLMPLFGGFLLCFDGGPLYLPMFVNIQKFAADAFIAAELIVVIELYKLDAFYGDIHSLMGDSKRRLRVCTWRFWKWRWNMAPAFAIVSAACDVFELCSSSENDLVYWGLYRIIQLLLLLSILILPLYFAARTCLQMKRHFEKVEKRTFTCYSVLKRQRHFRSWSRIEEKMSELDRQQAVEKLAREDPEDPNGFWWTVYRPFFRIVDTSDGSMDRQYPEEQQEDETQKSENKQFVLRFDTYDQFGKTEEELKTDERLKEEERRYKKGDEQNEKKSNEDVKAKSKEEERKSKEKSREEK